MGLSSRERAQAIEWVRDLFTADLTKVLLSVLIILSVLPFRWVQSYSVVFFGIFAVELALRALVLRHELRRRSLSRVELLFFFFDLLATLSFLPMESIWGEVRFLRLFRLTRMILLFSYWGPVVREIYFILKKRERRYQLAFVAAAVVILSCTSAILLAHFEARGVDFNGDGDSTNDRSFWSMLWWSFRQIESADNLLANPTASLAFFFSIVLTISGLFLFSFFIGLGTSIVEELMALSRERRIGVQQHSVICNVGPHSQVLLEELVTYYTKSFRAPRIITLGPSPTRYDYMLGGLLLKIRYRQGQPLSRHDLLKVDADRATRVILLGESNRETSDSEVVSQILSVREVNPTCSIYAELFRASNVQAALAAGGERAVLPTSAPAAPPTGEEEATLVDEVPVAPSSSEGSEVIAGRTVPVMARQLVSLLLADLIVFPGVEEIYEQLLTSLGDEIYTCLYGQGAMASQQPPSGPLPPFGELLERGHRGHGVILLGYLLDDPASPTGFSHALAPGGSETAHPSIPPVQALRGFFGVSTSFEEFKGFVESLPDVTARSGPGQAPELPCFGLCPGATRIDQFLVCGFHDGLADFGEELICFTRAPTITFMVPEGQPAAKVLQAFLDRTSSNETARVRYASDGEGRLRYTVAADPARNGLIRVIHGDWSDERALLERPEAGFRLAEVDAILLTYAAGEPDPDARTALTLLKLARLQETRPAALKAKLRIFCEVKSTEKAALLERRFGSRRAPDSRVCPAISILAAERLRNTLLAQSVFVPGIVPIYQDLLGQSAFSLCKLLPLERATAPARVTFGELLTELYGHHGILLVGVEVDDPQGGRRLVLNPGPRSEDYRLPLEHLTSIFAVGDFSRMPHADFCSGCRSR